MENHKNEKGGSRLERYNVKKYKKESRLTTQQKVLVGVAVVLAVAILAVLAWKSIFVRPDITKPSQDPSGSTSTEEILEYEGVSPKADGERKSKDYYTVLILGRDTGGGGNTDTMLLASYDVTNQKASVMSIPRDTMVNVSWDVKKINSVYNVYGGGDKGIRALYKEISQLVGFEPDFEVIVEWDAIGAIVEAIGGVWFDVPYPMDYHDPYQELVIEQEQGYRLLSGDDAMQVIRWRKNDADSPYGYTKGIGDTGRVKIQQDFLKAVIKQLLQLKNVTKIGQLAKVFEENVETDLSFQNILWFGQQAVAGALNGKFSVEDVTFVTMPHGYADAYSRYYSKQLGYPWYLSYVVPNGKELLKLVNTSLSPYKKEFKLSDLDIMYVNEDGSIGSTTGRVEDKEAALPPPIPKEPEKEPEVDPSTGVMVDPATGNVIPPESDGSKPIEGETGGDPIVDPNTPVSGENSGTVDLFAPENGDAQQPAPETGGETANVTPMPDLFSGTAA